MLLLVAHVGGSSGVATPVGLLVDGCVSGVCEELRVALAECCDVLLDDGSAVDVGRTVPLCADTRKTLGAYCAEHGHTSVV